MTPLLIEKKYFELNSRILKINNVEKSEKNRIICLFDILKARNAISKVRKLNLRLGIHLSITADGTEVEDSALLGTLNT